jgi:ADP-heptose:LPS heptosyltransferase
LYAIVPQVESQLNSRCSGAAPTLAIFPGALGDFVCFLPALDELARGREVDLLARSEYGGLLPPPIHALSIERRELARLFVAGADVDEAEEFFRRYDAIYSWHGSADAAFRENFARAAGAKGRLFPFRPAASRGHITDYYLASVGATPGALPKIAPRPAAVEWARAWLGAHGLDVKGNNGASVNGSNFRVKRNNPILVVAPGSGAKEKNWPRECFCAVLEEWQRSPGGKVAVVLGPAESDEEASFWAEHGAVARGLKLDELAALLSLADLYLGNDSGVTHLAAAVGAATLALFGPTDAAQWAPRGDNAHVVRLGVECSPCEHSTMKICLHRKCLTTLAPRDILSICNDILTQEPRRFPNLDKGVGRH